MYARHQAALDTLSQLVLMHANLPSLMQQAATLVANTMAVMYSTIWEHPPTGSTLIVRASTGWPLATLGLEIERSESLLPGAATSSAEPIVVDDWASESRFALPAPLRRADIASSLAVAIPGPSEPFGCLNVDVTALRRFSSEEVHFLQTVANLLALAIERTVRARLLEQQIEAHTHQMRQQLIDAAQTTAVLEERQRLARDLHDSVTQALYSLTLHAEGARRMLAAGDTARAEEALSRMQDTAQEALDEMRLLIFELRPPILEQVGLVAAIQARLNSVENRAKLRTHLIADELAELPAAIEQELYRVAQEALNNALKHAHAQHITVRLEQTPRALLLEVRDDGVGFEPASASAHGGLGLRGIAERVAQIGGALTLQSQPGAGTQVRVEVAL